MADELKCAPNDITDTLRWPAQGPRMEVLKYSGYAIQGYHYHTKERDDLRVVQNSGVSLVAKTMQISSSRDKNPIISNLAFFGVIQEIWELDYRKFRLPVFKCDWVRNKNGIQIDELGYTLVHHGRIGHKRDQFVLAIQVKQVFYIDDPLYSKWFVVLAMTKTNYNGCSHDDEVGDTVIDHHCFTRGLPSVEEFVGLIDKPHLAYKRDDCKSIWITNMKKKKS